MSLTYNGATLDDNTTQMLVEEARKLGVPPSFLIVKLHFEGVWGQSNVAKMDNNLSGMSVKEDAPNVFTRPSGVVAWKGSKRPAHERHNYIRYASLDDFFIDWLYLIRRGGIYKVADSPTFDKAVKGMFRCGGAKYDYATMNLDNGPSLERYRLYLKGMKARRTAINNTNGGKLDTLDNLKEGDETMGSIESMIKWMTDRVGKVTYSMARRLGPYSYDCSSAVYHALWAGGFKTRLGYAGNTETLFQEKGYLFEEISSSQARRGDIFVAGRQGGSLGGAGHTGIHLGDGKIIHCTYPKNGIAITPVAGWTGGPPVRWFRIKEAGGSVPIYKEPAVPFTPLEVGSMVTIREGATHWQTGERGIDNYVGESYKILQVKEVRQSYSKRAYLLDYLMSWALEQDIVEARKPAPKTSLSVAANQVVNGDHGNGPDRVNSLKSAGYTDAEIEEIQAIVNKAVGHTETLEVAKAQQDELSENEFMDKDGVVWIWRKKK